LYKEIPTFSLGYNETHLWLFKVDEPDWENSIWEQYLSGEEIDRSKRYKSENDRLRFIARRGLLRQLLGQYCGVAPDVISYRVNQFGKLSLFSYPICFNISASRDRVAFAFALENEIGIDIEQVCELPELFRMAERWFSTAEWAGMRTLKPEMQLDAFFHIWTQKEAFVKAHGEGLSIPLKEFSVAVDPSLPGGIWSFEDDAEDLSAWKMNTFVPESGLRVAVCVQSKSEKDIHLFNPARGDCLTFMGA
jgi:4'-phosphopantetheinyl transferase